MSLTFIVVVGRSFRRGPELRGPVRVESSFRLSVDDPRNDVTVSPHRGDPGQEDSGEKSE